ncbi:porin family protein [Vibrio sp. ZSDE26]|uniref:Porin family protein n=1 Tax=Vibrio amylolyticus TaxID=2847292 RepID=A0A9X2BFR9_9VIBR|nr:outer membrane beta-barrel protein [Vibrio amylolyticus]MCK6262054.1 porin family protein [Vibrio amylolyticus]
MKNTLLALTIATLAAPSVMATEYFVGGGLGYHSATTEIKAGGESRDKKSKGSAFHIRGGAYLAENHRVTGTINFTGDNDLINSGVYDISGEGFDMETNIDLAQTEFLISYDYIHNLNEKFSVFGGATIGMVKNKLTIDHTDFDDSDYSFKESGDESDFVYGLQAGVQYKITNEISADLQYRHMFESYSETGPNDVVKYSIPNNSEFTISLDYRF